MLKKITLIQEIGFERTQLANAISNALFDLYTNGDHRKIGEMTLYDLGGEISLRIADEVIKDIGDIVIQYVE